MDIVLPSDVQWYIREVFASCNQRASSKLSSIPTSHETSLDLTFVEHFSQFAAPVAFDSQWIVRLDTHYLGGGRHFGEWEIADVGLLVLFRRRGIVVKSKICLLQSKRLYPTEEAFHEDGPMDYLIGFGRLFESDEDFAESVEPRVFTFSEVSKYKALITEDSQYKAIRSYEEKYKIPVHYMLYNPLELPSTQSFPIASAIDHDGPCIMGTRVLPASALREALRTLSPGSRPSVDDLRTGTNRAYGDDIGWKLEDFVVEHLLTCKQGYVAERRDDNGLRQVFYRRSGPISAAIALTFDMPDIATA